MTKKNLLIIVLVWLCGLEFSVAQQPVPCLAVITEISGEVTVKKADKSEYVNALWGTQLFHGDQIKTSERSGVTLAFSNGDFVSLEQNSAITLSAKGTTADVKSSNVRNISSAMMVNLPSFTLKKNEKRDIGALADLRAVSAEQTIELNYPLNTVIKTNRPVFSWIPKKTFENYIVNLYNSKGLVWSSKISGNVMEYPVNQKELEFGETYFWNVEGENLIDSDKSANRKFSVISLEKSREVEVQEKAYKSTFREEQESSNLHSVLGAYYINQGLLQDAIEEFHIISKMNADAPLPHEILGSLYTEAGNKDKAIEELQKALELTKK
jgi:hypothetical protein